MSFKKDEILQVLAKDFNGQVDWWLCRLGTATGMVPANYLEIFHSHTPKEETKPLAVVNTEPKLQHSLSAPQPAPVISYPAGIPLDEYNDKYADYDFPRSTPAHTDDDYDMPADINDRDIYDRPPSAKSSPVSLSNRVSTASVASSQGGPTSPNAIYDVPPDVLQSSSSTSSLRRTLDEESQHGRLSRRTSGEDTDVSNMFDFEAEEFLKGCRKVIDKNFDSLWQCVYDSNAYWGSENKTRRKETLDTTMATTKQYIRSLQTLIDFGKGVTQSLENTKDINFRKKYTTANSMLITKKQELLVKLDVLIDADEKNVPITSTVKLLLEVARTVPQAVQAFNVLVLANKAILFKASSKEDTSPAIMTRTEARSRPLPTVPSSSLPVDPTAADDYADIPKSQKSPSPDWNKKSPSPDWNNTLNRRRNPQDELPPLPFATLQKPAHKKAKAKAKPRPSPLADDCDYDDIDGSSEAPPPPRPPRPEAFLSVNGNGTGIRPRNNLLRQSSGSVHSNSSDGTISPRRGGSPVPFSQSGGNMTNGSYVTMERSNSPTNRRDDSQLLARYSQQMEMLLPGLREAIEGFIDSIKNGDPPRDFVSKSKFAIVAAYKLVYIADALSQKLGHNDTKRLIVASNGQLTDTIKSIVSDTKTAALQYPNALAIEKMLDSLRGLFPSAIELVNAIKTS